MVELEIIILYSVLRDHWPFHIITTKCSHSTHLGMIPALPGFFDSGLACEAGQCFYQTYTIKDFIYIGILGLLIKLTNRETNARMKEQT